MRPILFTSILTLILLFSCKKEPIPKSYIARTYQELLDTLAMDCPVETPQGTFFKGKIKDQEVCYQHNTDGRFLDFGIKSKFTTSSPQLGNGGVSDVRKGACMSIWHSPLRYGEDYLVINFPDFAVDRDTTDYLDSLLNIEYHQVAAAKEERDKFTIELLLIDVSDNGAGVIINFPISTIFGPQDDSYVRIRKAKKKIKSDGIYYYVEMELECGLYHWSQYEKEGLWGKLEDGVFVAEFRAVKR